MYSSVYKALTQGGSIGIFPEGGSHDRTDLLPLKAGVSIMALGAVSAHPDLRLQIVPVGLSYFHAHKFRSRAVVEFGTPFEIPKEMVGQFEKGGEDKRKAIGDLMDIIVDGLKSVTVRAPDYDTLMVSFLSLSLSQENVQQGLTICFLGTFLSSFKPHEDYTVLLVNTSLLVKLSNSTNVSLSGTKSTKMSLESKSWSER